MQKVRHRLVTNLSSQHVLLKYIIGCVEKNEKGPYIYVMEKS